MWRYRYIFATILTFFCVEVGLWIFCKLGEPTVHVAKTQISPTGNRKKTDLQEMKFEIYSKQKGPTYKRGVKKIRPRFLKFSKYSKSKEDYFSTLQCVMVLFPLILFG